MPCFVSGGVRDEILRHYNVTYKLEKCCTLTVIGLKNLTSTRRPQELLFNYDSDYWLKYVVQYYEVLDSSSDLVVCSVDTPVGALGLLWGG